MDLLEDEGNAFEAEPDYEQAQSGDWMKYIPRTASKQARTRKPRKAMPRASWSRRSMGVSDMFSCSRRWWIVDQEGQLL